MDLDQWFPTCGTSTTGGTWAPLWWYTEESGVTQKRRNKTKVKLNTYITSGSSSDQAIAWNRLSSQVEMSMTAHLAVDLRSLITLNSYS